MRVGRRRAGVVALLVLATPVLAWATAIVDAGPAAAVGAPSTVVLASNRGVARYAQPITFTAHVMSVGGVGSPTGSVSFSAGVVALGSAPIVGGVATLNVASLATDLGNGVTATYPGDATFAGSASQAVNIPTARNQTFVVLQPVNGTGPDWCDNSGFCVWTLPATHQIVLEAVPFPDNPPGEPAPTVGPTGMVTFREVGGLGLTLGSVPLVHGLATVTVPLLPAGTYAPFVVYYPGDANYQRFNSEAAGVQLTGTPPPPRWRFETNDGVGGNAWGHLEADMGSGASTVTYAGVPHVFYYDRAHGDLRHAWYSGGWHAETLDGAGADAFGRLDADVGRHASALAYGGQLQAFYYDVSNGALRHAWWNGTRWSFETLDGSATAVASGHVARDVGETPATSTYGIQVHAYYYDVSNGDLRHAWWDGAHWNTETLDGNRVDGSGRRSADLGTDVAVALYAGAPHAWYYDATSKNLRHAWWTGTRWRFETLDGDVNGPYGREAGDLGQHPTVLIYGGAPHVWYYDASQGALRHASWTGAAWYYQILDGWSGFNGEVLANVGADAAAMLYGGAPHVWYRDATFGYLRHAWWDGSEWRFEALDGFVGGDGRRRGDLGNTPTVLALNGRPHVWYYNHTTGGLRHAWYG